MFMCLKHWRFLPGEMKSAVYVTDDEQLAQQTKQQARIDAIKWMDEFEHPKRYVRNPRYD